MKQIKRRSAVFAAFLLLLICISPTISAFGKKAVGQQITFGSYPQTQVTDSAVLTRLDALEKSWVSYGYYSGTGEPLDGRMTAGDFMKYADLTLDGARYRAVTFSTFRPARTGGTHAEDSAQAQNGYRTNDIYYFRFDPLTWRVLDPDTGLMLCERIIDAQPYQATVYSDGSTSWQSADASVYSNDYAASSLRRWLNHDFLQTAFSAEERSQLQSTVLENDGYNSAYRSASTEDSVFLLSWSDALNSAYGFSTSTVANFGREAAGTDYARCQGLNVQTNGNAWWWLRSAGDKSHAACSVSDDGHLYYSYYVYNTDEGIRPAICVPGADAAGAAASSNAKGSNVGAAAFRFLPVIAVGLAAIGLALVIVGLARQKKNRT